MHLLDAVTQTPNVTQRELSRRIGVALGLTNLMLRRLAKKGYIKVIGTKRHRIRYLITPKGILEKSRLAFEFLQYSLHFYRRARILLRGQLAALAGEGHRRFVLYGPGEFAEIAFLTLQEMGLECMGVVAEGAMKEPERFLGYSLLGLDALASIHYDRLIICSLPSSHQAMERIAATGIPLERVVTLPTTSDAERSSPELAVP